MAFFHVSRMLWLQLLQLLGDTFDTLVAAQYRLEDLEVDGLLPTLLETSGQAKERFRVAIRGLLAQVPFMCSYAKYSPLLLQVSVEPAYLPKACREYIELLGWWGYRVVTAWELSFCGVQAVRGLFSAEGNMVSLSSPLALRNVQV